MWLTFDFVLAYVNEGWRVYDVGGVVVDHLGSCREVKIGSGIITC